MHNDNKNQALGFLHVTPDMGPVKLVAELALTLVLFIDATMIDRSVFASGSRRLPVRLLLIGLPLTMVLGTLVGVWMFDDVSIGRKSVVFVNASCF